MTEPREGNRNPTVAMVAAEPLAGDLPFRRGWLLLSPPTELVSRASSGAASSAPIDWRVFGVGRASLSVHPARDVAVASDPSASVAIVGWAVDTTARTADQARVVRTMHRLLSESGEDALVRYAAYLGGRFVLISSHGDTLQVMPDAAATVAAFSAEREGSAWFGSHATLVANQVGAEPDRELRAFLREAAHGSRYVVFRPGARGDYPGVRHLLPNHVWRRRAGGPVVHERFYPFPETNLREPDAGRERFAHHFEAHVEAICARDNVTVSLTGGNDSGTTFRSVRRHGREDVFTWTMVSPGNAEMFGDAAYAAARSAAAGIPHRTVTLQAESTPAFEKAARETFSAGLQAFRFAATGHHLLPPDIVNLQSMLAEIGTGFYKKRTVRVPTVEALARLQANGPHGESRLARDAFAEFVDYADFRLEHFGPWDWYDMLYWESRAGLWAAARVAELELAHRVEEPYNSRHVLEALASGTWDQRQSRGVQITFMQEP